MPTLPQRQQTLLTTLIEEHIRTAGPIASQSLVGKRGLQVSPATIRNELMDLEQAGYLHQPHTSAGRLPTERAWRLYVQTVLERADTSSAQRPPAARASELREAVRGEGDRAAQVKALAKALADLCDEAVIVGFTVHDVYYTGLSHLFRQPEFHELREVLELSALVDRLDEIVAELFPAAGDQVAVLLGSENPLGDSCSLLITRCPLTSRDHGLLAVLGPVRQPYAEHLSLLRYATALLH